MKATNQSRALINIRHASYSFATPGQIDVYANCAAGQMLVRSYYPSLRYKSPDLYVDNDGIPNQEN